jgi:hypothetical protein
VKIATAGSAPRRLEMVKLSRDFRKPPRLPSMFSVRRSMFDVPKSTKSPLKDHLRYSTDSQSANQPLQIFSKI